MKRFMTSLPLAVLSLVSMFSVLTFTAPTASAAACTAPSTDYGTVTSTVNVATTGTYHIWSRMSAPDSASNSYKLEVTNNGVTNCYTVAGSATGTYTAGASTHFQSGSQNWSKTAQGGATISMSLTAGTTSIKMIGTAADVYLDRVVMTTDTGCTPTGTGDNCANPPDNTPPVANITSATPSTTVQGRVDIVANASDSDGAVAQVELLVDGSVVSGQTKTSGFGNMTFTVTGLSIGQHSFRIRATSVNASAGVTGSSADVNATVADVTSPTAASISSPANNSSQSGTITVTANGTDAVGVTKIEFFVDGNSTPFGTATASPVATSYTGTATLDTTTLSNASHAITAKVYDAANNSRTSTAVNITVNNSTGGTDTTGPTVTIPSALTSGSQVIAGRSYQFSGITVADASGISQVVIQVDGVTRTTKTSAPFDFTLDTSTFATGTRNITIRVTDDSAAKNVTTAAAFNVKVTALHDVTRDCRISINDIVYIGSRYTSSGANNAANVNGDGVVNIGDIVYVASRYTYTNPTGSQLPHPCTP